MITSNAKLSFSKDGKTAYLKLANEAEAIALKSKAKALTVIIHCVCKHRITRDEHDMFIHIIHSSKLPMGTLETECTITMLGKHTLRPMIDPQYVMCNCNHLLPHGYIRDAKGRFDKPVFMQEFGASLVELLYEFNVIAADEKAHVLKQIKDSRTPQLKLQALYFTQN